MIYETERLIVRKANISDRDSLYLMRIDPVILKYNCINPPKIDEFSAFIEKTKTDFEHYVIEHKESHQVIGEIDFSPDSLRYGVNSIMLSYHLNTAFVGKGYMSEALRKAIEYCFEVRHSDIISARVFTPNKQSNQLLQRLGFRLEGTLIHAVKAYQDVIYDDNLYSMTQDEYKSRLNKP